MNGKFKEDYKRKLLSLEEAARLIQTGDKIIGMIGVGEATAIIDAIGKRANAGEFDDVEFIAMGTSLSKGWFSPETYPHMRCNVTFIFSPEVRNAINNAYADFTPSHGSDFPRLITDYMIKDRAPGTTKLISYVSPMDKYGYFSFGAGPGYSLEASRLDNTTHIVQVNRNMPYVGGDNFIHISEVDYIVEHDEPLFTISAPEPSAEDLAIAGTIAEMIDDGSTIQLGIGSMPNTLGKLLVNKSDLGVHSEMISDAYMHLWAAGVITGKKKTVRPFKMVGCFAMGSSEVYEWLNYNPVIEMYSQAWTNNPYIIGQNNKMASINQILEIDLTGQAASEGIGPRIYSGTGGQANFVQGAYMSPGGKSFLCCKSTAETKAGRVSAIVPLLRHGAAVTTSRTDIQYVVTEYGIAQLKGKSFRQRAQELIGIAHPDFRGELRQEAKKLNLF